MHQVRLLIQGRVQGVGFRYYVASQARALGLSGEVRNRPDGSVEVWAEGNLELLRQFVEAVKRGPRGARVTHIGETWSEGPARHDSFRIGL